MGGTPVESRDVGDDGDSVARDDGHCEDRAELIDNGV